MPVLFHYTDKTAYNAIRSGPDWVFLARQPPKASGHPKGAYFTDYDEHTPALAQKLRIPKRKLAFFFAFRGADGLRPLRGGRGKHIFFSTTDYRVAPARQAGHGKVAP